MLRSFGREFLVKIALKTRNKQRNKYMQQIVYSL